MNVTLTRARPEDATLLANLFELYAHDMSEWFDVEPGEDGRFGYEHLSRYWSEPERRFAFVIRLDGRLAGFVLAMRGSPASEDPEVLDVAEFFVLRRYRREGVGRRAAVLLWEELRGDWTVRVLERNANAVRFWAGAIREYTNDNVREWVADGWRVFAFASERHTIGA